MKFLEKSNFQDDKQHCTEYGYKNRDRYQNHPLLPKRGCQTPQASQIEWSR